MKYLKILLLITIAASCKTVKKVATIQEAIDKKDTTQTVVITETPKVDSAAIVRNIMEKVVTNNIQFKTFNAKIKVDYESAENSDSYTGYLSIAKDSLIYIRIRGSFLGISAEGLQVKITKDSVVLVKKVGEKYVQYRTIDYLKEATQIPFDFSTLQDLLIGNPVFMTNNIVSYRDGPTTLSVLMVGEIFKHLISLSNEDFKVVHSKLDDVDIQRNRTCAISFSNYQPMGTYQFATQRKIVVAEKSKLDINLDFKEFSLNEPLKYAFEIPKNYKRK
ncbi:DUF4292 domain-containing protein [Sediminibacterium sp. C3]|uniref:DUF4292 domain-containing protein n=1 Tax=Sediminibacterium sp. C3 TaxID=1267211 RepID=UPI0004168CEA|nr:DUF4292 domain-containing protein [Sediminibacterium sp. C3]